METGTYLGDTLAKLCDDFDGLQSIELSADYYARAVSRFASRPQVRLINADSTTGLETALSRLSDGRAIFWLDAHYSGGDTARGQSNTPVESELRAILAYPQRSDIILVDDLRYFWQARPGFRQHDALLGYPSMRDLIGLLNSGAHQYDCFALSDALLAVPSSLRDAYRVSPLLQALTRSREGLTVETGLSEAERLIATAPEAELIPLMEIPNDLLGQSEYGLAGHYFYWRALVRFERGDRAALEDCDVAERCGVIPEGSLLSKRGSGPVGKGTTR